MIISYQACSSLEHARCHSHVLCLNMFFQAIMAEGKQHALAIGYTKMSAKDM
jgi:hypothetical protein